MESENSVSTAITSAGKNIPSLKAVKIFGVVSFAAIAALMFHGKDYWAGYKYLAYSSMYLSSVCFLMLFNHNKYVKGFLKLYTFPIDIMLLLSPLLSTVFSINMTLCIILLLSLTTAAYLLPDLTGLTFPEHIQLYIGATLTAIILTTFGDRMIKFFHYLTNKDYREFSETLALRLAGQKKFKYLIYFLYFLALIYFNLAPALNLYNISDQNLSTAILQSFATFLAYDRLISNKHLLKADPKKT